VSRMWGGMGGWMDGRVGGLMDGWMDGYVGLKEPAPPIYSVHPFLFIPSHPSYHGTTHCWAPIHPSNHTTTHNPHNTTTHRTHSPTHPSTSNHTTTHNPHSIFNFHCELKNQRGQVRFFIYFLCLATQATTVPFFSCLFHPFFQFLPHNNAADTTSPISFSFST
jgi:hypothetical protein